MPATRSRTRTVQTSPHEIQKVQRGDLQLLNDEEIKRYAAVGLSLPLATSCSPTLLIFSEL